MGHRSRLVREQKASLSCSTLLHDLPTSVRLQASRAVNLLLAPGHDGVSVILPAVVTLGVLHDTARFAVDGAAALARLAPGNGFLRRVPIGILVVDNGCRSYQTKDTGSNEIGVVVMLLAGTVIAAVFVPAMLLTVVIVTTMAAVPVTMSAMMLVPLAMPAVAVLAMVVPAMTVMAMVVPPVAVAMVSMPFPMMLLGMAMLVAMTVLRMLPPMLLALVLLAMPLIDLTLVTRIRVALALVAGRGRIRERQGQGKGQYRGYSFVTQHLIVLLDCGRRLNFAWA